jgi:predicted lipoprotein with Yx(FWY)xxD motif
MMKSILLLSMLSTLALSSCAWAASELATFDVKLPVLVDSNQLTVYTFDNDTGGVPSCYNGCAKAWPPVLHSASAAAPQAPFAVIARKDGSSQLTYKGHPLYNYAGDSSPGDITGDGLGGVWHIVVSPALN